MSDSNGKQRHQVKSWLSICCRTKVIYSSHHKIIKFVDFKSIQCFINLNVASFSRVSIKFDCVFIKCIANLN